MKTISVVISAYNEEEKIAECLESVKEFADEIIVVDNASTDKTSDIAKKYTKKVYHQKNDPEHIDIQKNYGFTKATGEWILSLDADERVTQSLAVQIKGIVATSTVDMVGYWIPRKNMIFGKWIQHTGWYPDFQLRLFRNGRGSYSDAYVHAHLSLEGATEKLTEPIVHLNFETIHQFLFKHMMLYAPSEAAKMLADGYQFQWSDAIVMPVKEFMSRFFAREGYKDGFHGLMLSLFMAFYHLLIFANIWERMKFIEAGTGDILSDVEDIVKKSGKDMHYWLATEKLKKAKGLSEKFMLKMKRKFI